MSEAGTKGRTAQILAGLHEQNEHAEFEGRRGFWVQSDAIFIEAPHPQAAIEQYRRELVACSHNHFCGSILHAKANRELQALTSERDRLREEVAIELEFKRGSIAEIVSLKNRLMDCQIERDAAIARESTLRGLLVRALPYVKNIANFRNDEDSKPAKLASEIESALEGGGSA